jgi:hypothetical protein
MLKDYFPEAAWSKHCWTGSGDYSALGRKTQRLHRKRTMRGLRRKIRRHPIARHAGNGPALIPANGFYEWKKVGGGKILYAIGMKDHSAFVFAGLWECRKPIKRAKKSWSPSLPARHACLVHQSKG